jgi:outer membrane protein, heavy metal efflux system
MTRYCTRRVSRAALLGTAVLLAGCATYTPAPLDPAASAQEFSGRRLDSSELARYLTEHGSTAPTTGWRSTDLALAALYWQPGLDRARAAWHAAQAGEITAGARPQPAVQSEFGYGTSSESFGSRWFAAVGAIFTPELGGKRGARIATARAHTAAAEVDLEAAAWRTARAVRDASTELAAASERLVDATDELERVHGFAERLRRRYEEGAVGRGELVAIEAEETAGRAAVARETRAVAAARTALAQAVGVPATALEDLRFVDETTPSCDTASARMLQAQALQRRPEIGRGLADYAVAEGGLRLAVADAFPDISLGPAFTYDLGIPRWSLLLNLVRIPFNRNRGPIAEATARRAEAAARFAEVQQNVIAEVDGAVAGCRVAESDIAGADSALAATRRRAGVARGAYERGELGAADLEPLELAETRAIRELHAARRRAAVSALALEAATGAWPPGDVRWPDPKTSVRLAKAAR